MDDPDEVIVMQLTCMKCQRTVTNNAPRELIPTQIAFNAHLQAAGWKVHPSGSLCLKCVSSS